MRRLTTPFFVCIIALVLAGRPAAAHPLGNFTINHLSAIAVQPHAVDVRYVLDMAEIPTFAEMRQVDPSGRMSAGQLAQWANRQAAALVPELNLRVDGVPAPLTIDAATAKTRPGAGGLPTLYLVVQTHAPLAGGARHALSYEDGTYAGRLGWKDVVVAPATEPTHELTVYPNALLGSPRNVTSATIGVSATGAVSTAPAVAQAAGAPAASSAVRSNQLSDLLAKGTSSPAFVLLTLLVAVALGALHALEPGHGKTLLAVSLVGARATAGQAAILAGALTVAHTAGVLLLGVAIIALKGAFVPEAVYPWITLLSGVAVAFIGARAVSRQISANRPYAHAHAHGHAHAHPHEHEHVHHPLGEQDHAHDDGHSHAIPGNRPLRFGPTVVAAMSGGIAPCPAALVVLFAAIAQNALAYGVVAIVFFSFGLAATLTGLGIAVVRGASWLGARPKLGRLVRYGPLVSAAIIAVVGSVMVGQGMVQQGLPVSAPIVTALTALAIVGYAFAHPLGRAREAQAA